MPYILGDRRKTIYRENEGVVNISEIKNAGELNYAFSIIVKEYFGSKAKGNYQAINDIIGALEGAKMEFTRRITNDYEDKKIKENGDIF